MFQMIFRARCKSCGAKLDSAMTIKGEQGLKFPVVIQNFSVTAPPGWQVDGNDMFCPAHPPMRILNPNELPTPEAMVKTLEQLRGGAGQ